MARWTVLRYTQQTMYCTVPEMDLQNDHTIAQDPNRYRSHTAEHRLYAAILSSAIEDYRKYQHIENRYARHLVREVRQWMDGSEATVPFEDCCRVLALVPSAVRKVIR